MFSDLASGDLAPQAQDDPAEEIIDDADAILTRETGTLADPDGKAEYDEGYGAWYQDTNLWVLVAFLIVVAILVSQGIAAKLKGALNARADGIRSQLDEARTLREDAQKLLADYQKRGRAAEAEAQGIIDQAKADAKAMSKEARQQIDAQLARRTKAAEDRIARAEAQAVAEVRGQATELAVGAARRLIARQSGDAGLTDRAIADVAQRLG